MKSTHVWLPLSKWSTIRTRLMPPWLLVPPWLLMPPWLLTCAQHRITDAVCLLRVGFTTCPERAIGRSNCALTHECLARKGGHKGLGTRLRYLEHLSKHNMAPRMVDLPSSWRWPQGGTGQAAKTSFPGEAVDHMQRQTIASVNDTDVCAKRDGREKICRSARFRV